MIRRIPIPASLCLPLLTFLVATIFLRASSSAFEILSLLLWELIKEIPPSTGSLPSHGPIDTFHLLNSRITPLLLFCQGFISPLFKEADKKEDEEEE